MRVRVRRTWWQTRWLLRFEFERKRLMQPLKGHKNGFSPWSKKGCPVQIEGEHGRGARRRAQFGFAPVRLGSDRGGMAAGVCVTVRVRVSVPCGEQREARCDATAGRLVPTRHGPCGCACGS